MKEVISLGKLKTEVQNMEFSKIIGIEQMFSGYNCMQRLVKDLIQAYLFVQKRKAKYIDKQIKCSYFNPYGKKKTCFGSTENRHENLGHE